MLFICVKIRWLICKWLKSMFDKAGKTCILIIYYKKYLKLRYSTILYKSIMKILVFELINN